MLGDEMGAVELRAGAIRYRDVGSGPVLLFVHGVFVNGLLWGQVVGELSKRFRCVVPDLPLGAHSPAMRADADLTPPGVAGMLHEFIAALELQDVTLIGNDTGGALCQLAIVQRSERIAGLVLTNCDAYENFFAPSVRAFQYLPRIPGFIWLFAQMMRPRRAQRALGLSLARRGIDDAALDAFFAPVLQDANVRRDLRKFLITVSNRYTLEAAKRFGSFEKPVLIAWGQQDLFFPRRDGERLAKSFPNAQLERIAESRTFVPVDQPAMLAALVTEFVGTKVPA
jgi:pimeloyl-ACP methyl ester carboxylesterase